nr:hypothetical protein Iba_chr03dCG12720 [Ipomoea batatas]
MFAILHLVITQDRLLSSFSASRFWLQQISMAELYSPNHFLICTDTAGDLDFFQIHVIATFHHILRRAAASHRFLHPDLVNIFPGIYLLARWEGDLYKMK